MIRVATQLDSRQILELARIIGFDNDEVNIVEDTLKNHFLDPAIAKWFVAENDTGFVGVIYCAPEVMTKGTWNTLMLLVHPDAQGKGHGRSLLKHAESELTKEKVRLLIVETSSLDDFSRAREFYKKAGYTEETHIKEFYSPGNDKVIFTKRLGCRP